MQNRTAPGAVMDKRNRNKMLPQRKRAVGEGQNNNIKHKDTYGNSVGGDSNALQNLVQRGRDQSTRGCRIQTNF